MQTSTAMITNDAVVLGLLALILGFVFHTSHSANPFWQKFYRYVPSVLLCYFIPSLFNSFGIIDGEHSQLYQMASRYLLPVCLVLLTLSVDFRAILGLGPKALVLFLTGTVGVVLGGPIALATVGHFFPEQLGGEGADAAWRGMSTIAGSWIGGSANQAAMKEVFQPSGEIFSVMITVDVLVANIWTAVLLWMAANAARLDKANGADTRALEHLKGKIEKYQAENSRNPSTNDLMMIIAVGFGVAGLSHWLANIIAPWIEQHAPELAMYSLTSTFFWIVVLATTFGLLLSGTKLRHLEATGASKVGSVMVYILVATIGMHMDVTAIVDYPVMFLVGLVWISIHAALLLGMMKLLKAPVFYMAVGSQANIGGAASAPVVAAAFHPSLAPVGVLLAVLGYALGTYGGYLSALMMQAVAP
ncbi:DUF819 family protein [Rheinheimera sp. F8]|uniref:DUF819 family protein n=1 Tax=Rheinheimera sp. F8 TaxID=1763998 RepID=UPI0007448F2F|nr:DUF819 family protein [Rheinheimera sp. F8]ALZ75425.1 hypothetical protein ATY27_06435 [Rheinheimera sp. F8]ALZ77545.1 hypothetical protein ATY27_18425 [Rheinheimera sp. F8]